MADPRFIHLRTHTEYSLLEGALRLKKLPGMCADMGMPAVAVTDTNNLFAALEFSVGAAGAGVQPIIGCQIDLRYFEHAPGERIRPPAPVVLLAQTERGYEHLMKLNSCLYLRRDNELAHVTLDELEAHSEDVICLSGGPDGPVGRLLRTNSRAAAQTLMTRLHSIFEDRLYVELQRHPGEDGTPPEAEQLTERGFVEMAYEMGLPLVATNDVYFPKSTMYEAHDAMICIAEGAYVDQQEPRRRLTPQHYLKTPQEMAVLFADLPEALENTVEIAKRCAFMAYRLVHHHHGDAGQGELLRAAVLQRPAHRADCERGVGTQLLHLLPYGAAAHAQRCAQPHGLAEPSAHSVRLDRELARRGQQQRGHPSAALAPAGQRVGHRREDKRERLPRPRRRADCRVVPRHEHRNGLRLHGGRRVHAHPRKRLAQPRIQPGALSVKRPRGRRNPARHSAAGRACPQELGLHAQVLALAFCCRVVRRS